ncbi:hypothetical protein KXD40_004736 [Peronospora effusa]|uniref:Uncharacterized protein n=1 Tax=Peronospora effusa TaxID=542832 RepID=A0A3M6VPD1_9STRA|nr:hypothetical protein DD238_004972 [Peronospora effusa]UIZ27793.1 hypothetical protein KXD40_004736 [Peronospora effusa]
MTSNAYQLWLKKRESKAPRLPLSPRVSSSITLIPQLPRASKSIEDVCNTFQATLDAVSALETTLPSVLSASLATIKRPREEEEGTGHKKQLYATNVAGCANVVGNKHVKVAEQSDKVAGWKRQQREQELMKMMIWKKTSPLKVTSQPLVRSIEERPKLTKRVDADPSFKKQEEKEPTKSRDCSMQLHQMKKRKIQAGATFDGTIKRLRFDADTKDGGIDSLDGVKDVEQLEKSLNHREKTIRTLVTNEDHTTTKRLRYCSGNAEEKEKDVESCGLPSKSPMKPKQKNVTISMLDESQYWMAVDRFSHLA